jgi:hypothetical protein
MTFEDQLREELEAVPIESDLVGGHVFPSGKGVTAPGSVDERLQRIEFAIGALRNGLMLIGAKLAEIEKRLDESIV